jgi:uncharacterized protein
VIVVADTSVLLNLCRIEQVDLLRALFAEIVIPPEVASEFARLAAVSARFHGLVLPAWIRQQPTTASRTMPGGLPLHAGEIAALSLAMELRADAILIDERSGHAAAQILGLKAIGLLGVLLQAKAAGYLPVIRPTIERLERDANFWLSSSLRERVLKVAGEL